jgi:hypothetical protein
MASPALLDKHQLAGVDERERGFSRPLELEPAGRGYRAVLRYERMVVATDPHDTQDMALQSLIRILQSRGCRQLKTQMSFRDGLYLGSQEMWIEYPDSSPLQPAGWLAKIVRWFQRRAVKD